MKKTNQKQLGFALLEDKIARQFGGSLLKSNPKVKRPISFRKSMHLVLRSSLAKGQHSFLRKDDAIESIIHKQAKQFGVKVYRFANGGNHLHLVILPSTRDSYKNFIRSVSGLIARLVLNTQRGSIGSASRSRLKDSKLPKQRFWDFRPYTRIVEWGRDFKRLSLYLAENTLEAIGYLPYVPREVGGAKRRRELRRAIVFG
ncbi:MAG: hypothetical protein COT74_06650 [Bdellovibrionales bacterium CG10_big_fil_rev_8_21_14_0_10_45_34]|nr:MAG: hypothetical protein COT74_06650 [Bdellovibrionales bacterium CG10_big_fil_rev_8_21_14_0_10_45_34]